jgi:hypothetical protein
MERNEIEPNERNGMEPNERNGMEHNEIGPNERNGMDPNERNEMEIAMKSTTTKWKSQCLGLQATDSDYSTIAT